MTKVEKKLWGTIFTPTLVLAWPFLFVLLIALWYFQVNYSNYSINEYLLPIWLVGLIFFWFGGLFIKLLFPKENANEGLRLLYAAQFRYPKAKLRFLLIIIFLLILPLVWKVYSLMNIYSFNIGNDDFQKELGGGFVSHVKLFLTLIAIFFIVFFEKKYFKEYQIIVIVFTLLLAILYAVKSWIIIPLISALIGRILLKKSELTYKIAPIIVAPFLIFWLIYQISLGMDSTYNEFIFRHMGDYLFAGIIGFSEHLTQKMPIGENAVYAFTPISNIIHYIVGEELLSPISTYWVSTPSGFETNVKSFFGTLYIYGGSTFVGTSFVLGLIFYRILVYFCKSLKSKLAPFGTILYVFMLGLLFMGWFELYVMHLLFYEIPVLVFILHLIFKLKTHESSYSQ